MANVSSLLASLKPVNRRSSVILTSQEKEKKRVTHFKKLIKTVVSNSATVNLSKVGWESSNHLYSNKQSFLNDFNKRLALETTVQVKVIRGPNGGTFIHPKNVQFKPLSVKGTPQLLPYSLLLEYAATRTQLTESSDNITEPRFLLNKPERYVQISEMPYKGISVIMDVDTTIWSAIKCMPEEFGKFSDTFHIWKSKIADEYLQLSSNGMYLFRRFLCYESVR